MGSKIVRKAPDICALKAELPLSDAAKAIKRSVDDELKAIARGESNKLIVIVGPCSADDEAAVRDYCGRLSDVRDKLSERLLIIPRVFTIKPRSKGVGYKGMLHDDSDGNMTQALYDVRRLYINILDECRMPSAYDLIYPELFGYFDDLISYVMVGARSVENQLHRFAASGVDALCGMKNPMGGSISAMLNSIHASQSPQKIILGGYELDMTGNEYAHGILRGYVDHAGANIPNYSFKDLLEISAAYSESDLKNSMLLVDTNHSNSNKRFEKQAEIALDVMNSRRSSPEIRALVKGFLIESYIEEGSQPEDGTIYGKSITDGCLSWNDTENLLNEIYKRSVENCLRNPL